MRQIITVMGIHNMILVGGVQCIYMKCGINERSAISVGGGCVLHIHITFCC